MCNTYQHHKHTQFTHVTHIYPHRLQSNSSQLMNIVDTLCVQVYRVNHKRSLVNIGIAKTKTTTGWLTVHWFHTLDPAPELPKVEAIKSEGPKVETIKMEG